MAFTIKYGGEQAGDWVTVDARLCLTEDDRLVPEGDPDGRWLFTIPGRRVPMADAIRYGLICEEEADLDEVEDKAADLDEVEDKAKPKPRPKSKPKPRPKQAGD